LIFFVYRYIKIIIYNKSKRGKAKRNIATRIKFLKETLTKTAPAKGIQKANLTES